MAGRTIEFGKYGADGVPGAIALAQQLDRLMGGISSPVDSERGLAARLKYLTNSEAGYEAMERAGLDITQRTLIAWLAEERFPNPVNLAKIDQAYQDYRRRNVVKSLTARLEANGGTRIEINPVDQSHVVPGRERDLRPRSVNVRQWEEIVEAWAEGDLDTLDEWWDEIIQDLGSDYDAYSHVSSLGFSA